MLNYFVKGKISVLYVQETIQEKLTLVILVKLILSVFTLVLDALIAKKILTQLTQSFAKFT